jgi:hypothetical protein
LEGEGGIPEKADLSGVSPVDWQCVFEYTWFAAERFARAWKGKRT